MELNLSKIGVLSENISASTVVTSSIGTRTTGTGTSSNLARQKIFSMVTNKFLGTTVHFHPIIKNDVLECNGVISEQVETLLDDHEKILEIGLLIVFENDRFFKNDKQPFFIRLFFTKRLLTKGLC